ncbi:LCP family protein [Phycicoccus avicenniae]|uniref:LCP family protein n=1 Tax=Phycicoccus avicenniae TaxID=2828860 RepID=UPI003D2D65BA
MDGAAHRGGEHEPDPHDAFPSRREVHGTGRRPWRRRLAIALVLVVALGGAGVAYATWRLNANITKVDVSKAIGTDRPTQAAQARGAVNILLVGSDTREGKGNDAIGKVVEDPGQHSDTNLLVHLSKDRTWATVVSIPRDSMTKAPPECSPTAPKDQWVTRQWNHNYKIGGIGCLIRTLEGNTGVRIDHYGVVDFRGFQSMVQALGGVEVCTTEAIDDRESGLRLSPGTHTLKGKQALAYVRTRKSVGDGSDLGRIQRQQAFLSSIAQKATSSQLLFEPTRLFGFLDAATKSLTTDPEFGLGTMKDLAESVRGIGLKNIEFVTVPNEVYPNDENRVQWQPSAELIWESFREDHQLGRKPKPGATPSPSATPLSVSPDAVRVQVLNGSGASGLASQAAAALGVQGFRVTGTGNGESRTGTLVEYSTGQEEAARTVAAAFPGAKVEEATGLGRTVRVTMGAGSKNVVEVENRTGTKALPKQPVSAPTPAPTPTPTISARAANADICKTS